MENNNQIIDAILNLNNQVRANQEVLINRIGNIENIQIQVQQQVQALTQGQTQLQQQVQALTQGQLQLTQGQTQLQHQMNVNHNALLVILNQNAGRNQSC